LSNNKKNKNIDPAGGNTRSGQRGKGRAGRDDSQSRSRKKSPIPVTRVSAAGTTGRGKPASGLTSMQKYFIIPFGFIGIINGVAGVVARGEAIYLLNFFLGVLFLLSAARVIVPKHRRLITRVTFLVVAGAVISGYLSLRGIPVWPR